ncbi:MAG: MopE-related protein [Polyangiaceae bacterium]
MTRIASLTVFALAVLGCLEVPSRANDGRAMRDVVTPDGSALDQACTPNAVELCFDAIDNNCNGVIDEGCGLHSGVLQFAIAWDANEADVNLEVTDPAGETAQVGEGTTSGLYKDRDCPRDGAICFGQNVENVYLLGGEPERGRYKVVARLDRLGGATAPIHVHLGVRVGPRSYSLRFDLAPGAGSNEKTLEFTL